MRRYLVVAVIFLFSHFLTSEALAVCNEPFAFSEPTTETTDGTDTKKRRPTSRKSGVGSVS